MSDDRQCTCHLDDNPPVPCAKQYALRECREVARLRIRCANQRRELLDLLELMFDAYEDGPDCYEDPDDCAGHIGKAVLLDDATFHRIADILNLHRPRTEDAMNRYGVSQSYYDEMAARYEAAKAAYEQVQKDCVNLTEKVIPNLREEIERLRSLIVCGFYEDETPTFRQGEPQHELESAVTAEECTVMVAKIERLRAERDDWHRVADSRSAEINRLMNELAAAKALLREAFAQRHRMLSDWPDDLQDRIRAALGDEPADRSTGHQPE